MTLPTPESGDDDSEISVLIKTLRASDQRLEELTAGEVDTIADREGRSYVLNHAQNELRHNEAARQAAILDALPASVVLLDAHGIIVSVNEAWRRLGDTNLLRDPTYGVGRDYLAICDAARGTQASGAAEIAAGIRDVLSVRIPRFSVEYPCETPAGMSWFLLTVTPLQGHRQQGAVVMHVDITAEKRNEQALLRFAAAMDATADAIYLTDRETMQFVHFNEAACRMRQQTRAQIMAAGPYAALGLPREELERALDALIAGGVPAEPLELMLRRADGTPYWIELRRDALCMEGRWIVVSMVRDVTDRKQAELRISQLNRVHAMLSGINTLIVRAQHRGELFTDACRIAVEAGGFVMAWIGILDRGALEIVPVASVGATEALLKCIEEGVSMRDAATVPASPTVRVIRGKQSIVVDDAQAGSAAAFPRPYTEAGIHSFAEFPLIVADEAVGVFALYARENGFFHRDEMKLLTELAGDVAFAIDHLDKQERLVYLSYYDPLTGLANRVLFLDRVTQRLNDAAQDGQKIALVLIDIERFKNINDTLGLPAGDALLKQVAVWLTHRVGDAGRVARLDADHFALVLPAVTSAGDLASLLEKARDVFLKHSFQWNGVSYRLAAKTGVALFPEDGADADTLFRNAEAALKNAKNRGDHSLFYAEKMTATVAGRLSLENQLRQALEREQFVLHYQPKFSVATGKLTGAEALIRWNDPHTGLVPPGRFIPILEETGLIREVGRWALAKAVEEYLCWRRAGLGAVRIAVNVSPLQLGNRGFVAEFEKVIGIDPLAVAGVELEITESLIMADVKHSIATLQRIRGLGVTVAIDDFGTGFSSLSYLAKLPVTTLKIDRSFVVDMAAPPQANALVSMIIQLAHSLQLSVVAEGVETEEQLELLRSLGCDQTQGYLLGRPVPSAAFASDYLTFRKPTAPPSV